MSQLHFHWFLPTYGDSRSLMKGGHGSFMSGSRPGNHKYLKQLSLAAEQNHFESVLIPTGLWCEDPWITASSLVDATETLKFLIAIRPGLLSPLTAAQMSAALQRHSGNRMLLNIVVGGEDYEQKAYGDFLDKDARYYRAGEFLEIFRRLWREDQPVNFAGEHIAVENAVLRHEGVKMPQIFFGGSSDVAGKIAAEYADTYLTWGELPDQVQEKKLWIDSLASLRQRPIDHGIRLHVISRDTSADAWNVAQKLLDEIDYASVKAAQETMKESVSVGQHRMTELLHKSARFTGTNQAREFEIYPNIWSGVGLVRGGAGTALVGSHQEVAERIEEYAALGMQHFILSGYPHLEEAYYFGEGVRPILEQKDLLACASSVA